MFTINSKWTIRIGGGGPGGGMTPFSDPLFRTIHLVSWVRRWHKWQSYLNYIKWLVCCFFLGGGSIFCHGPCQGYGVVRKLCLAATGIITLRWGGNSQGYALLALIQYWFLISVSPSIFWFSLTWFAVSSDVGSCTGILRFVRRHFRYF